MIKINLALRKQAGSSAGGASAQLGAQLDVLRDLPLKRPILLLVTMYAASWALDDHKQKELTRVDAELARLQEDLLKVKGELAKTKGFEEIKKTLDSDEQMIRTKIDTVEKLIAGRHMAPKMMVAISSGIPPEVWLSQFRIMGEKIDIMGSSLDFNQISDFMKNLSESAYYADVKLMATNQKRDEAGREIATFELTARKRKDDGT